MSVKLLNKYLLNNGKFITGRLPALIWSNVRCFGDENIKENKRPASAFAMFFKEKHPVLKRDNPLMTPTDLMRLASNLWKNQSLSNQEHFKTEYEERLQIYKQSIKEIPKRPATPYILFFKEKNLLLSNDYPNVVERAKQCGYMWQNLSDAEKHKYRETYEMALEQYNENLTEEDKQNIQEKKDSKKKRKAKK